MTVNGVCVRVCSEGVFHGTLFHVCGVNAPSDRPLCVPSVQNSTQNKISNLPRLFRVFSC